MAEGDLLHIHLKYGQGVVVIEGGLLCINIHIYLNCNAIGLLTLKQVVVIEGGLLHIHLCIHLNCVHRQTHTYDAIGSLVFEML